MLHLFSYAVLNPYSYYSSHKGGGLFAQELSILRTGRGIYNIGIRIGIFALVISILMIGIGLVFGGKAARVEAKSRIPKIVLVGIIMFSLAGITTAIFSVAGSIQLWAPQQRP